MPLAKVARSIDLGFESIGQLRWMGRQNALVTTNFTDSAISNEFSFSEAGTYRELLHDSELQVGNLGSPEMISIPSNYGRVWLHGS